MSRVVTESRAYDAHFDSTYISSNIPSQTIAQDPRVSNALSQPHVVAGTARYKYFRRPVMPRLSAIPPQVLLAPTATMDPSVPVEEQAEPATKSAGIQTMYRESEAQTMPYTPAHIVPDGTTPEVLLLKNLNYENGGLSVGKKELEMIEYARLKRDVEANLPPFTDEASMLLRKRLMEAQELREFKLRESEMDAKREARIFVLEQALRERTESAEFLASQRVESIRQARMEERETNLQKIRNKRIKVLRKLANRRNQQEPQLSSTEPKDIIDSYFDKASEVYAPIRRKGELSNVDGEKYDIKSRTVPMDVMKNIMGLEESIPDKIKSSTVELGVRLNPMKPPKQLNETGYLLEKKGGRAAEPRMTSAAMRAERTKKRDVEEMARIIARQKIGDRAGTRGSAGTAPGTASSMASPAPGTAHEGGPADAGLGSPLPASPIGKGSPKLGRKGVKVRPPSPDFVRQDKVDKEESFSLSLAMVILQKLLRGRAVQNMMYEGRYRRAELIAELRYSDEVARAEAANLSRPVVDVSEGFAENNAGAVLEESSIMEEAGGGSKPLVGIDFSEEEKLERERKVRDVTLDSAVGSVASNLVSSLVQEQIRQDMIADMSTKAAAAMEIRRMREAAEAGRRQREHMLLPVSATPASAQMASSAADGAEAEAEAKAVVAEMKENEEEEDLLPVELIRDPNRPPTPPEVDTVQLLAEMVDMIIGQAVENVSRPTTAAQEADATGALEVEPEPELEAEASAEGGEGEVVSSGAGAGAEMTDEL